MHGWNQIERERILSFEKKSGTNNLTSSESAAVSLAYALSPPRRSERRAKPEELSYYRSIRACVLQNVFVSLPPSRGCAQTASLQPCLSFCPLQQTPAETEKQSLLQSPIICNPPGTQNHTTWPKKAERVPHHGKPPRWCALNFTSPKFYSNSIPESSSDVWCHSEKLSPESSGKIYTNTGMSLGFIFSTAIKENLNVTETKQSWPLTLTFVFLYHWE